MKVNSFEKTWTLLRYDLGVYGTQKLHCIINIVYKSLLFHFIIIILFFTHDLSPNSRL